MIDSVCPSTPVNGPGHEWLVAMCTPGLVQPAGFEPWK